MVKGTLFRTLAVVTALSIFGLSACGSSDSEGSNTASSSSDDLAAATTAFNEALRTDVKLPMPSDPVTMGKHKLAIINLGLNSSFGPIEGRFVIEAAKKTGWDYKQFDGQLDNTKIAGFMIQAVQENYDAIILMTTDVNTIAAATQQALDAGVTIACISCITEGKFAGKVIDLGGDIEKQGERLAAAMVARSGADTKVVRFTDPSFNSVTPATVGVTAGVKKYCPSCAAVKVETMPVQELTKPGPPTWSSFLASTAAGSGYTDAVGWASRVAEIMDATLAQTGRTDLKVSSPAATAEWISSIKSGEDGEFGTVEPNEYMAWAAIDLLARKMADMEVYDASGLYSPLVDKSNADKFLPVGVYQPDGQDYKRDFTALWKQ